MSTKDDHDWFTCPVCGEVVDADALCCPACGADDQTGWSDQADYDGLDLPGDPDDRARPDRPGSRLIMALVTLILIALLVAGLIMGF